MRYLPPDPINYGLTTDNIGNVIAFIRPSTIDDVVNDLEHGDLTLALDVLKEIQTEIKKLPSLYQPYANTDSEPEHISEEIS